MAGRFGERPAIFNSGSATIDMHQLPTGPARVMPTPKTGGSRWRA